MRTHLPVLLLGLASCGMIGHGDPNAPAPASDHGAVDPRQDFQLVALKHASAEEVSKVLNDFLAATTGSSAAVPQNASARPPGSEIHFIADPRTNSLLVKAPHAQLPSILELVSLLDRRGP